MRRLAWLGGWLVCSACGAGTAELGGGDAVGGQVSYAEFLKGVYREPESGVFIVDGDTPLVDEKQLRAFYEENVQWGQLIVHRVGSADAKWNDAQKLNLTYCVSDAFGARKAAVVQAMAEASGAWAQAANVKLVHVAAQDASCTAQNGAVVFDVNPVNANGSYLARAFFPNQSRSSRNVLIDGSAFGASQPSLAGVLRHELGHALGFRHEHTRPEAGTCFEDNSWRPLTAYDSASVMHYPQCKGTGGWALNLTALDKQGAAALYGAPGGSAPPPSTDPTTTESFSGSVAKGQTVAVGSFAVKPGSTLEVVMSGSGDPDLYVRFGASPTTSQYDCRPYLGGAAESCSLTVPAAASRAYVSVVGFTAASYQLKVTYVKGTATPPPSGTARTETFTGQLAKGAQASHGPLRVVAGTQLEVRMSGSGDPDLYVRFGEQPTLTQFDCRPYLDGPAESCALTVPAGQSQAFLMVEGYAAASYTLTASYVAP